MYNNREKTEKAKERRTETGSQWHWPKHNKHSSSQKQKSSHLHLLDGKSSTAPTTAPHCLTWAWLCQPVPSHTVLPICGRHGSLSGTSGPARLQLTFQLYQDGIRCNLNARDVEFADVGAVIRALSSTDATREKGEVVRAVMGRAHRTQIGGRWVEISISKPRAHG